MVNDMKKGFKLCPYCGKEIKSKAIKCQYCFKFLEEEKKEKECPYCLNNIDVNAKICPFCDEKLINDEVVVGNIENKEKFDTDELEEKKIHNNKTKKKKKQPERNMKKEGLIGLIVLGCLFLIGFIFKYSKKNYDGYEPFKSNVKVIENFDTSKIKTYNADNSNSTISDTEQFELNLKCQELYTNKYFWTGMFKSYWDRSEKGEHRNSANTYEYEIFYSPVEKSCVFAIKKERDNCGLVVGKCTKVNELNDYDFAQVIYYIDIIRSSSKSEANMFLDYCYKKDTPNELFTRCSNPGIDLSKYKNGWFSLVEQTRKEFDDEVRRLKGK